MVYFVTENFIKTTTPVSENVDANDIMPSIYTAAMGYVRPIIGTVFFNDLLTKYNAQTLNNDEINLVQDWIKPAIAWRACQQISISATFQLKNKGLQTQSGDFSQTPEYRAAMFVSHEYGDRAAMFENLLLKHLEDKTVAALYPVFLQNNNKEALARRKNCEMEPYVFQSAIHVI